VSPGCRGHRLADRRGRARRVGPSRRDGTQ
jgi:hypothetical protein